MKKLLLSAITLVAFSSANAQITYKGSVNNLVIPPKEFCYNGQIKFVAEEHDYNDYYKFMTLDENFEIEKTFTFNCKGSEYIRTYQRKREGSAVIENYEDELLYENISSWEEAKEGDSYGWWYNAVEKDNYELWPEDDFYNYYEYNIFGAKYPRWIYYWNPENKNVYKRYYSYKTLYTGDWYTYDSTTYTNYTEPCYFTYYDYDNNGSLSGEGYGAGFYATQTLFNSDEKYEMLITHTSQSETIDDEGDFDGDGEIDHRVIESGEFITGYSIISEDGDVIFSINSDYQRNDMYKYGEVYILKANGKFYIYDGNIWEINRETSSIKQVAKLKGMRVSPTIAEQTDNITVELGEGSNAKEIVVVNGNGQVVKQIPVKNGERQITINAGSLNRGLNILNARGAKGNNNCKIIVK